MIRLEAYEDLGGKWRWRLLAANGQTVASSNESFVSHANALRAAARVQQLVPQAKVVSTPGQGIKDLIKKLVDQSLAKQRL